MDFLRKFTIQQRLSMLVVLIIIGLSVLDIMSLSEEYKSLLEQKKHTTQELVDSAYGIVQHHYALQQKGELSESKAKEQTLSILAGLRYDTNNYYWVNDFTPNMIMHPIKPALNGKNVAGIKDADGRALFIDMVTVAKAKGDGFVYYKWAKPGFDKPVDKIGFVKGFTPWQWIIGSGTYLDDIEATFAKQRNMLIIDSVIIALFIVILSFVTVNSILKPTLSAAKLLKDIATGDGTLTNASDDTGHI